MRSASICSGCGAAGAGTRSVSSPHGRLPAERAAAAAAATGQGALGAAARARGGSGARLHEVRIALGNIQLHRAIGNNGLRSSGGSTRRAVRQRRQDSHAAQAAGGGAYFAWRPPTLCLLSPITVGHSADPLISTSSSSTPFVRLPGPAAREGDGKHRGGRPQPGRACNAAAQTAAMLAGGCTARRLAPARAAASGGGSGWAGHALWDAT